MSHQESICAILSYSFDSPAKDKMNILRFLKEIRENTILTILRFNKGISEKTILTRIMR